jgi:REP element-mobilizing transposase RayT
MTDEEKRQQAEAVLRDVDLGDWSVLIDEISPDLEDVYADGMSEGLRLLDMDVPVDHVHALAVQWAQDRAASLVTQISENTRSMLRSTVEDALEQRWGARELAAAIAASTGFSYDRAETISRSELSAANNQGNLQGYKTAAQSGVRVLKEWLDNDSEDVCADNADEGPIELDEDFPSGSDAPPEHPNCLCSLAPVVLDETESDDEE